MTITIESLPVRDFDGIVCFGGEDWWYHNRGHYDMQMMRHLSRWMPVLYVNSLGMRMPNPGEGRMFLTRIGRKLRSVRRGFVRVGENFSVCSPLLLPGRAGIALSRPVLGRVVRAAASRQGITRPLVWVACPTGAEVVDVLDPAAVVYQRTDRYECYQGVNRQRIANYDGWLKARADLTVFCSTMLSESEAGQCRRSCLVDHGVDFDRFVSAGSGDAWEPGDVASLPRPRVGFIGGIDPQTFDPDLFLQLVRRVPEAHFVLVGACSLPRGWCPHPNVSLLGQRPYESVPDYMAACDVLIMPWNRSRWIEACNPVKLKEYLATGRPVVSTPFAELRRYEDVVRVAQGADEFARAIRAALGESVDPARGRERVRDQGWSIRAAEVLGELETAGIRATHRPAETPGALARGRRPAPRARPVTPAAPRSEHAAPATAAPPVVRGEHPRVELAACILLAGGLRPSPLVAAAGRSILDLWLTPAGSLLDGWAELLADLAAHRGRRLPVRVVHDAIAPPPWPGAKAGRPIVIEQEPKALRGPAGVTRDLCRVYAADQHVLVAEAARWVGVSLAPMVDDHQATGADITVATNPDGTPAGVYLVRCGTLDLVPAVGFMDLKEQWLRRAVDAGLSVRVHRLRPPGSISLRTRGQLLDAARIANGAGERGIRVVCPGALIGPGSTIVDSVVMPGAIIEPMAMVVRTLVCPDARVDAGADIVDSIVSTSECLSDGVRSAV